MKRFIMNLLNLNMIIKLFELDVRDAKHSAECAYKQSSLLQLEISDIKKKVEKLQQWVAGHETLLKTDGDWNKAMKDLNNIKGKYNG